MKNIIIILGLLISGNTFAQNTIKFIVSSEKTKETLVGASAFIKQLNKGETANDKGEIIFNNIPNGEYEFEFSYSGYDKKIKTLKFPLANPNEIIDIELAPKSNELDQVIVT